MKKFLSLLLSVLFVFSFAAAEAFTPVGTWYLIEFSMGEMVFAPADLGMEMVMTLNEDGTGLLAITGEEDQEAVWTAEGDVVNVTTTGDGMVQVFNIVDGNLCAEDGGITMVMSQEAPEATTYVPAATVAAADVTAFDGGWEAQCVYAAELDMTMPFSMVAPTLESSLGTDMGYITIENGITQLIPEQPGTMYFEGVFSNGMLTVYNTSDPTLVAATLELQEDGMLRMTVNGIPMFYAPVAAE